MRTPARYMLLLLLGAPAAWAQPPLLSPAAPLPGDATIGAAAGIQRAADAALGTDHVLAVWEDHRTVFGTTLIPEQSASDIYATRLDAFGVPVEDVPIVVTQALGDQIRPQVAWNGQEWLVVYLSQVPTEFYYTDAIQAVRVSAAGVVLDAIPLTVESAATAGNLELFGVASDGNQFAVFWKDWVGNGWRVRARRISGAGAFVDPAPVDVVLNVPSQPYHGDVAFAQDEYLVVWNHWGGGKDDVYGRRLTPGLSGLGPNLFKIGGDGNYDVRPALATDGTSFLVAWENYDTCCVCGGGVVRAARVTHAGVVTDTTPIKVLDYCAITISREPTVSWDGAQWLVAWTDEQGGWSNLQIRAARVSPQGTVLDPNGFDVDPNPSRHEQPVAVAAPGGGSFLVWTDHRAGGAMPDDLWLAPVPQDGQPLVADVISLGAPRQHAPDLAANGAGYLAVFTSGTSGGQRVLGHVLDAAGHAFAAEPVELVPAGPTVTAPAVAWNGSTYLLVWQETLAKPTIFARRLGPGGVPLDAAPIQVMEGNAPDVAAIGDTFVVVATNAPTNPHFQFPFAARVAAATGAVLDATPTQLGQYFARNASVGVFGARFLAAWQRNFSHDDAHAEILAAFVDLDGTSPGSFTIAGGYGYQFDPDVASNGANAFVTWQHDTVSTLKANVLGRLVNPDQSLGSTFTVANAANPQFEPAAAFDGLEYVAAWEDMRNIPVFFDARTDLFGARVGTGGAVVDAAGFGILHESVPEVDPAVAGFDGAALFAGARFATGGGLDAYRIVVRAMNDPCQGGLAAYGPGCPGSSGTMPVLTAAGCSEPGGAVTMDIRHGLPNATALVLLGASAVAAPLPNGCMLLVGPPAFPLVLPLSPQGNVVIGAGLPAAVPPATIAVQAFLGDALLPHGYSATNGLLLVIP